MLGTEVAVITALYTFIERNSKVKRTSSPVNAGGHGEFLAFIQGDCWRTKRLGQFSAFEGLSSCNNIREPTRETRFNAKR